MGTSPPPLKLSPASPEGVTALVQAPSAGAGQAPRGWEQSRGHRPKQSITIGGLARGPAACRAALLGFLAASVRLAFVCTVPGMRRLHFCVWAGAGSFWGWNDTGEICAEGHTRGRSPRTSWVRAAPKPLRKALVLPQKPGRAMGEQPTSWQGGLEPSDRPCLWGWGEQAGGEARGPGRAGPHTHLSYSVPV